MRRPAYRVLYIAPPGIQGVTYCAARHTGCYITDLESSRILSNAFKSFQIFQILSDPFKYFQILSDPFKSFQTLSHPLKSF